MMATLVVLSPRLSGAETGQAQMDACCGDIEARKVIQERATSEAAAAYTKAYELYPQQNSLEKWQPLEKTVSDQKYCADAEAAWRRFSVSVVTARKGRWLCVKSMR